MGIIGMLLLSLAVGAGCAQTAKLRGGLSAAEERIKQVEANGAYTCAPRELALAQSHLRFARLEIRQGMGSRAQYHYEIAMENLNLADRRSPPEQCAGPSVVVAQPLPRPMPPGCKDDDKDYICADVDQCPDQPEDYDGVQDDDGCPEDQDTDMDGILDSVDQCVLDQEDPDGFQDDDGCPDPDNDMDEVPDFSDQCSDQPEDPDGFKDDDGCPDDDNDGDGVLDLEDECPNTAGVASEAGCPKKYEGVQITATRIEINQTIYFAYNKATIKPVSFPILNTVAEVLNDNPDIRLSIEGHTDSKGNDNYNKKLSDKRAKAVMDYLVKKGGVSRSRLTSVGWGEEQPIDTNLTEEGRAANRRVEFVRTDNTE